MVISFVRAVKKRHRAQVRQKETAMSVFERITIDSFRMLLLTIIAAAAFMAPTVSHAEKIPLMLEPADRRPVPEITLHTVKRTMDVGLNENGDLMIKRGDVALIMAYNPPEGFIEPQERIRIAQRQDCPSISGISLKASFLF